MAHVEMVMPKMGESIMEGTILSWLKKVGENIEQDESVLEVATDKVDTEVPSTYSGVLLEILANEGDVVEVGKAIAVIEVDDSQVAAKEDALEEEIAAAAAAETLLVDAVEKHSAAAVKPAAPKTQTQKSEVGKFYSPLVMTIAREEGISIQELDNLQGTGKEGRVTKRDVMALLRDKNPKTFGSEPGIKSKSSSKPKPKFGNQPTPAIFTGEDEIIQMDRMRKMIADRMLSSVQTAPHVTSFVEADLTSVVNWRNQHKKAFMNEYGQALTFTPIFIEAIASAIRDYPMINVQVEGDTIVKKGNINIGMAVALPSGNLIVPVIKNADRKSIKELSFAVNDLARRGRDNKLTADDLSDGTYTMSNVGSFGNVMGTPILVQPQVGILALGTIVKKASVIETAEGDFIGIRHKMFLSHSYDHRVVDGALGGMFVRRVADYLEQFDTTRSI
ncbi:MULTISPECIES: dihydrolipoamide acetyltransferase family protein [Reichenbachiella]|uniref:Dihydrolipoamide acetyltransferase component of pyruvate dehydrogenase complex n=1 Tax=Reichenbachiella agariperforans TaxID=156994 RepID=A0A1M6LGB8_REIAG|nr:MULTISPECIES: dihydrolipoamide acetyltransferase family protein [Reichenbachiella]MBU2913914.1 2-oxo acid dehydrogenase subunit E2 [Reichenbachiella agariperforans]RJE74173.1 2-oxoglutarate dehydrogenase [Reichenbachiella sp. MSK19-1]SHJ70264.1 2-oxoglutarate dehydrogenase E2 component (dihydrolipoamide succinyltransferase) [Reichenbachiella agariperforans]